MRDLYPGYKSPSDDDLTELWKTCIFAFDASALLDCYRLTPTSCDEYFWALEKVKDRLWLPHQAGLEYYDNRIEVIESGEASYERIPQLARDAANLFKKSLDRYRQYRWIDAERWMSILDSGVQQIISEISKEEHVLKGYLATDPIEARLQTLFAGKVGDPYPSMYEIFMRAEQRLQLSIPPGFKDLADKKDFHRYGDVVLWFQLLDFAKSSKRGLVFITSDAKTDWWSRESGKTSGVRPELVQEMHVAAGVPFHMYTPNRFMEYAKQFFGSAETAPVLDRAAQELLEVQSEKEAESERLAQEYYSLLQGVRKAIESYRGVGGSQTVSEQLRKAMESYQLDAPWSVSEQLRKAMESYQLDAPWSVSEQLRKAIESYRPDAAPQTVSEQVRKAMQGYQMDPGLSAGVAEQLRKAMEGYRIDPGLTAGVAEQVRKAMEGYRIDPGLSAGVAEQVRKAMEGYRIDPGLSAGVAEQVRKAAQHTAPLEETQPKQTESAKEEDGEDKER